jgi:hypothetical protein
MTTGSVCLCTPAQGPRISIDPRAPPAGGRDALVQHTVQADAPRGNLHRDAQTSRARNFASA